MESKNTWKKIKEVIDRIYAGPWYKKIAVWITYSFFIQGNKKKA